MNSEIFNNLLTTKLFEAQESQGLSPDNVAEALQIGVRQLRRYYRGETEFTTDILLKLEDILNIKIFDLSITSPIKKATMPITKESIEFSTGILSWCLKNGITDHAKIEELFDLISSGLDQSPPLEPAAQEHSSKYKTLRLSKNLSIRQLAKETGFHHGAISRLERTGKEPLNSNMMEKLDKFYNA